MNCTIFNNESCDKSVKKRGVEVEYYSKNQMEDLYPDGGHTYTVVGYTALNKPNGKRDDKHSFTVTLDGDTEGFEAVGIKKFNKLLYRIDGYACVGSDKYVGILKSRLLLLILLGLALLAAIGALVVTLLLPANLKPSGPVPDEDPNVVTVEDEGPRAEPESGGEVTLIFTKKADINLSTGEIAMYFKNPTTSSHDYVLELYIKSGEKTVKVATSGLITAGHALEKMTLDTSAAKLSEGSYEGLYRVMLYKPGAETTSPSMVVSQITDLSIVTTK